MVFCLKQLSSFSLRFKLNSFLKKKSLKDGNFFNLNFPD